MSFDSVLNTVVPIFIAIFFLFILGKAVSKPMGGLYHWIRGMFHSKKEELQEIGSETLFYE